MKPNPKKLIVGICASLSTLVSVGLWIWYSNIPSFQSEKSWDELKNVTFENATLEDLR